MSDVTRLPNGRFPPGVSGGRSGGRRRTGSSADEAVIDAFAEKVIITEGGKRRKIDKLHATAKQIAHEGATGKQARQALAVVQNAQQRVRNGEKSPETLRESDQAIVARFIARLALTTKDSLDANDAGRV